MPRLSRTESYSGFYHIMTRGINKKEIFESESNKEKLFYIIKEKNSDVDCQIYSYCIMDNHLHLLVKAEMEDLSLFMKKINGSYAIYYNYINERVGSVFQDSFKTKSNLMDFHLKQDETMYLEIEEDLNRINMEIGNRIVKKLLEENAVEELSQLNDKSELIMRLLQTGRFSYSEIVKLAECSRYQVFNCNKSLNLEGE